MHWLPGYLDPLAVEQQWATTFLQFLWFSAFIRAESQLFPRSQRTYFTVEPKVVLLAIFYHLGPIGVLFLQGQYLAIWWCDPLIVLSDQLSVYLISEQAWLCFDDEHLDDHTGFSCLNTAEPFLILLFKSTSILPSEVW